MKQLHKGDWCAYQLVLNETELEALETGSRHQVVAEIEEIERAHGLDDLHLTDQQVENLHDSLRVVVDRAHAFLQIKGKSIAHFSRM